MRGRGYNWAVDALGRDMGAVPDILTFDEVGSTSDVARELAEKGAGHGSAVAARRQSAGRGRRGHVWSSPEGNLYLSVLLRPRVAPSRLPGLAAVCGLGALAGLAQAGVSNAPQLKWPNDLLAHDRKLGGILVEAGRDEHGEPFAVCGLGINLESAPRGLDAICLAEFGAVPSFSALATALRDALVRRVDAWAAHDAVEPLAGIREDYLAHLAWLGEQVVALSPGGEPLAAGRLATVDPWGRAVLKTTDGPASFSAEQASLRPAASVP